MKTAVHPRTKNQTGRTLEENHKNPSIKGWLRKKKREKKGNSKPQLIGFRLRCSLKSIENHAMTMAHRHLGLGGEAQHGGVAEEGHGVGKGAGLGGLQKSETKRIYP